MKGFAAGLMLSISFFDLTHNALNSLGFLRGNLWFFAGVIFFAVVAKFIPEPTVAPPTSDEKKVGKEGNKGIMKRRRRQVLISGVVTAIGISLHNFPEGMAVYLGSMKGIRVGLNLALAIALHNIPEGVAVALPVYFATQSKWEAFKLASLSGFAEPLGVVIVACLFPTSLNPEILEGILGSVGGVMAFLTLHEMLPLANQCYYHLLFVVTLVRNYLMHYKVIKFNIGGCAACIFYVLAYQRTCRWELSLSFLNEMHSDVKLVRCQH
ncbi:Zinc transporter ZTP29 [Glycine max]|nr:Zinc transporter ZTP29 [Glycine max]